jgi:hypothetical protein
MGIEQFLSAEDKKAALTEVKSLLEREIYFLCLKHGIDTDTIDIETFTVQGVVGAGPSSMMGYSIIETHCKNLVAVNAKLASME